MLLKIWIAILQFFGLVRRPDFIAELSEMNPSPESVVPGRLIIVGTRDYQKWAYFRCPCGCGEIIMLSLNQKKRPCWSVSMQNPKQPTIHPSVQQTAGCFSHFWIRKGVVDWCNDTGVPLRR